VLCRNEEEARKDAERRAMLLAGLERKLKEGDKSLVGNKGFDYEKAENDAKFDGIFVLRTSTKLSAREVVLRYRNLLAVEDAFRAAKAPFATRPI
jgi:hypothetical protein